MRSTRRSRDDLNTAAGLGAIFDLVRALNIAMDQKQVGEGRRADDPRRLRPLRSTCSACCRCAAPRTRQPPIPQAEIEAAIEARQDARRARDFAEADRIRQDLLARA